MNVAIIGYQSAGKSSLYRAAAKGHAKGDVTAVPVPDPRFDAIVDQVKPKKATPATVILYDDVEAAQGSGKAFSQRFIDSAKKADLLLHVVRAFDSPMAPYHASIEPTRDQEAIDVELVLSDLQIVENRLEKLKKSLNVKSPGTPDYLEKALFEKLAVHLGEGLPIRSLELSDDDATIVRNYQLLSAKPMVVAFNVGEGEAVDPPKDLVDRCAQLAARGTPAFCACATLEEEIAQLDSADQPEFLASLGLAEPASARVVRAVYEALGLHTFFTAGENDTRAWALRKGATALKAASTIHTDIAKGFIRAEIVHYADYALTGSLDKAYSAGKMSLEGKDYVIQDGDLIHIRNKS